MVIIPFDIQLSIRNGLHIQRNLRIKDTLGPATLSFVERLSSSRRLKLYQHCRERIIWDRQLCPLYREVCPLSECPLSEVPLYTISYTNSHLQCYIILHIKILFSMPDKIRIIIMFSFDFLSLSTCVCRCSILMTMNSRLCLKDTAHFVGNPQTQ